MGHFHKIATTFSTYSGIRIIHSSTMAKLNKLQLAIRIESSITKSLGISEADSLPWYKHFIFIFQKLAPYKFEFLRTGYLHHQILVLTPIHLVELEHFDHRHALKIKIAQLKHLLQKMHVLFHPEQTKFLVHQ